MNQTFTHTTPPAKPPLSRRHDDHEGSERQLQWSLLVPLIVNPIKVTVIEAMHYLGQPVSATDLHKSFGKFSVAHLSYYMRTLAKAGVVERCGSKRSEALSRGSTS
jgi:hypothetical protein